MLSPLKRSSYEICFSNANYLRTVDQSNHEESPLAQTQEIPSPTKQVSPSNDDEPPPYDEVPFGIIYSNQPPPSVALLPFNPNLFDSKEVDKVSRLITMYTELRLIFGKNNPVNSDVKIVGSPASTPSFSPMNVQPVKEEAGEDIQISMQLATRIIAKASNILFSHVLLKRKIVDFMKNVAELDAVRILKCSNPGIKEVLLRQCEYIESKRRLELVTAFALTVIVSLSPIIAFSALISQLRPLRSLSDQGMKIMVAFTCIKCALEKLYDMRYRDSNSVIRNLNQEMCEAIDFDVMYLNGVVSHHSRHSSNTNHSTTQNSSHSSGSSSSHSPSTHMSSQNSSHPSGSSSSRLPSTHTSTQSSSSHLKK